MINKNKKYGFTIVELLVVIVVIGILAAITIVSYSGIQQRSRIASIQSDLRTAATAVGIDYVNNGDTYPIDATSANGGSGLRASGGNTLEYVPSSSGYCINVSSIADASLIYHVSSENSGNIEEGECPRLNKIAGGSYHSCAIATNNDLYCWGGQGVGELGNGNLASSRFPVAVSKTGVLSGKTIITVAGGEYSTCAVASDNRAYCWGYNNNGQLGDGTNTTRSSPVAVNTSGVLSGKKVNSISLSDYHACVVTSEYKAYCWGDNQYGQLGDNSTTDRYTPVAVNTAGVLSGKSIKAIAAGGRFTCALSTENLVYCWGSNVRGQLGDNSTNSSLVPVAVNTASGSGLNGKTVKAITAGRNDSTYGATACAIASDGYAYCWGNNANNQIGDGSGNYKIIPTAVPRTGALSGKTIKAISIGGIHTCAIASDNLPYCWGYNDFGEIGNGSKYTGNLPPTATVTTGALSGKTVKFISSGCAHTCAIASDDKTYCWGNNDNGEIGDNTIVDKYSPTITQSFP